MCPTKLSKIRVQSREHRSSGLKNPFTTVFNLIDLTLKKQTMANTCKENRRACFLYRQKGPEVQALSKICLGTPVQKLSFPSLGHLSMQTCGKTSYKNTHAHNINCSKKLKHHFFRPSVKLRKNIVEA